MALMQRTAETAQRTIASTHSAPTIYNSASRCGSRRQQPVPPRIYDVPLRLMHARLDGGVSSLYRQSAERERERERDRDEN